MEEGSEEEEVREEEWPHLISVSLLAASPSTPALSSPGRSRCRVKIIRLLSVGRG